MGILIKNPEAERIVRELAQLTGESLTTAVEIAARERLPSKRGEVHPHRTRSVRTAGLDHEEIPDPGDAFSLTDVRSALG